MKTLFLFLFFITTAFADCNYNCECADIPHVGIPDTPIFHTKGSGCFNNLTIDSFFAACFGTLDNSAGIYPDHPEKLTISVLINPYRQYRVALDVFEELGLVCENGKWMITKFPYGTEDRNQHCDEFPCMSASESNGKGYRAELDHIEYL
ncbi:unnamed protein product [Caenorhabditis brenneri]